MNPYLHFECIQTEVWSWFCDPKQYFKFQFCPSLLFGAAGRKISLVLEFEVNPNSQNSIICGFSQPCLSWGQPFWFPPAHLHLRVTCILHVQRPPWDIAIVGPTFMMSPPCAVSIGLNYGKPHPNLQFCIFFHLWVQNRPESLWMEKVKWWSTWDQGTT